MSYLDTAEEVSPEHDSAKILVPHEDCDTALMLLKTQQVLYVCLRFPFLSHLIKTLSKGLLIANWTFYCVFFFLPLFCKDQFCKLHYKYLSYKLSQLNCGSLKLLQSYDLVGFAFVSYSDRQLTKQGLWNVVILFYIQTLQQMYFNTLSMTNVQ